jgi:hypothetical protein
MSREKCLILILGIIFSLSKRRNPKEKNMNNSDEPLYAEEKPQSKAGRISLYFVAGIFFNFLFSIIFGTLTGAHELWSISIIFILLDIINPLLWFAGIISAVIGLIKDEGARKLPFISLLVHILILLPFICVSIITVAGL